MYTQGVDAHEDGNIVGDLCDSAAEFVRSYLTQVGLSEGVRGDLLSEMRCYVRACLHITSSSMPCVELSSYYDFRFYKFAFLFMFMVLLLLVGG